MKNSGNSCPGVVGIVILGPTWETKGCIWIGDVSDVHLLFGSIINLHIIILTYIQYSLPFHIQLPFHTQLVENFLWKIHSKQACI